MAVAEHLDTRLKLTFQNGIDPNSGKELYKTKSFNNVKTSSTADQLFAIATALAPLQQLTLSSVKRNDTELLMAE